MLQAKPSTPTSNRKNQNQCIKILKQQSIQSIDQWLQKHKISSYSIRNQKATQIINISNYIFSKILVNNQPSPHIFVQYLTQHYKNSNKKIQFCKILRHFSLKDYQFDFILSIAQMARYQPQNDIGLYMRVKQRVIGGFINKNKKQLMSSVNGQIQQWYKIGKTIFKSVEQKQLLNIFTNVVKDHYVSIKKDQSVNLNGVQFFKICQIITKKLNHLDTVSQNTLKGSEVKNQKSVKRVFDETLLNGLQSDDRQLIRVLAYKDNNVAKLLQQKHNKMIRMIAQQVNQLRENMHQQKNKHMKIIQEKNNAIKRTQKIKEAVLEYIADHSTTNQIKVLTLLDRFCLENQLPNKDIQDTRKRLHNRKLIQVIQKQELQND